MSRSPLASFAVRTLVPVLLTLGSAFGRLPLASAQSFEFPAPVDLGTNLDHIGDLQWSETLGTAWDSNFSFGKIVGKRNATVIPEVRDPLFNEVIIPRVSADTRTGARMRGHVSGSTGLELFASFNASGLEPGTAFDFHPRIVDLPPQVRSGEFLNLQTSPGVVSNPAFTEDFVDLPSFEAGMDFFFHLDLNSRIEGGLFPIIPYGSTNFNPPAIHFDQREDAEKSLLKFEFDLDPKSNNGVGTPPTFVILEGTPFEERLGLLDDGESVYEKQISVDMSVKGEPVKRQLDIGSVQLVNPFGTGDSILGPDERNLTISTATDAGAIRYSYETPLLRLGLDLDGLAAYFGSAALTGAGHSFTRIEEDIKVNNEKIAEITADMIDVKYGPEFGVRETVEIKPDFEVTLEFDREVAINDGGQITFTDIHTGKWSELPGIALLDDEAVEVSVSFDWLTGQQTKRSVIYLTDYLEMTLLDLEELEVLNTFSVSAPPLFRTRTSLLGSLLDEVELEMTDQSAPITPFRVDTGLLGSFMLRPEPSTMVYLAASGDEFSTDVSAWRELATHDEPASLDNAVLVIATGDNSAQLDSDLEPTLLVDEGAGGFVQISVLGLTVPEGSTFQQRGSRAWSLSRIVNDGLYHFDGDSIQFDAQALLTIRGQGEMRSEGTSTTISAPSLFHGPDHTLTLAGAGGSIFVDEFDNAGQITIDNSVITQVVADQRVSNSGSIAILRGGDNRLTTPVLANDGRIEVSGGSTALNVSHPDTFGQINIQSTTGTGRFIARDGATLRFTDTLLFDTPGVEPNPVRFEAKSGATIRFDSYLRAFDAGVAELNVDETSTMVLNGVEVKREDAKVSLVNHGLVEVMSGSNRFYYDPDVPFEPGEEPRIVGINVDNQGTVHIHPGASFGFQAEIVNYVPGGATLGPGTWEIVGDVPPDPFINSGENVFIPGVRQSQLEIDIAFIVNEDTYLGRIDLGDTDGDGMPDGYSAEDYDTFLAISEANVLLSGAARFDYFNTIRENRGAITLRNNNHFDTDGDLLNSGEIRVESDARLNVFGDLTVDEGSVFVDDSSVLDVQGNTIEVIGGQLTVEQGPGAVFVNRPWIVREKWIGIDDDGDDVILDGRVSFGAAHIHGIGEQGDVRLEGERALFEPLSGLRQITLGGTLSLTGGSELDLAQSLTAAGTLALNTAGKLYVDGEIINNGHLEIDAQSYLEATDELITRPDPGGSSQPSIRLDGVLNTPNLAIWENATLSGTGRLTGKLTSTGTLSLEVDPADSDDHERLRIDGEAMLSGNLQLELASDVLPAPGDDFAVLTADGGLDGGFANVQAGQRLQTADEFGSFIVEYGTTSPFDPNQIVVSAFEPDPLLGDYNDSGLIEQGDLDLVLVNWGAAAVPVPEGWNRFLPKGFVDQADLDRVLVNWGTTAARTGIDNAAVPEPHAWLLLVIGLAGMAGIASRKGTF